MNPCSNLHRWCVRIIVVLGIVGFALAVGGCATVPQSVQEANTKRLEQVAAITGQLTSARNERPQVEVAINLPPGQYEVPAEGWHLATVQIYDSLDLIGMTDLNQTDWQISENVAISALRVIAPLTAFLGGQYFTQQMHRDNTRMMTNISAGSFGIASQAVAKEPLILNAVD